MIVCLKSSKNSHRIAKQFLRHYRFLLQRSCRLSRGRRQLSSWDFQKKKTEPLAPSRRLGLPLPPPRAEKKYRNVHQEVFSALRVFFPIPSAIILFGAFQVKRKGSEKSTFLAIFAEGGAVGGKHGSIWQNCV